MASKLAIRVFFALILVSTVTQGADPKWIHLHSANFDLLSSASERETRNTLQYFEQVREFFLKLNGHEPKSPAPVHIIIFGSEKEYAPYSLNQVATAYFTPRGSRDYIVMGRTGEQAEHIATHEYTHLVADHAGLKYPPWLSEGLAELFSTFTVLNNSISIGDPIPGRILQLRDDRWVPLSVIMAADHNSPYYNETGKAGSLYNEGWAVVHFLGTTTEYRPKFSAFLIAVAGGDSGPDAIQKVYGKSLIAFETELRGYIGQGAFNHLVGKLEIDRTKKAVAVEPASPFDVKVALNDIDDRPGSKETRRRNLEALKLENPKRPEPWESLAYLNWEEGKSADALTEFSKAYELGARNNRFLWDFGRMAQGSRPAESILALKDLATLEPNRAEVRIELAWSQFRARQIADAAKTLGSTTIENTEQAPRYFSLLAYIQLEAEDRAAAARSLELLKRYSKTDADRRQADALQRYISDSTARVAALAPPETSAADDLRPSLRRTSPPVGVSANEIQTAPPLLTLNGTLLEFVCPETGGKGFKLVINSTEGKKTFAFNTPESISVRGKADGRVDLFCGTQTGAVRVKAEYRKAPNPEADDILSILTFEP